MIEFPRDDFWDYAIGLYAEADVAPACLALQERLGLDVNLVLFCLWCAASGREALSATELDRALAAVGPWHEEVVRHLRALRKHLKGGFDQAPGALVEALRRVVAATEIDAEHIEQLMLSAALARPAEETGGPPARARVAAANLAAYLARLGVEPAEADRADALVLLAAAFPGVPREELPVLELTADSAGPK